MTWLNEITGTSVETPESMHAALVVEGSDLVRVSDNTRFRMGQLTTPSLTDLRMTDMPNRGPLRCCERVGDTQTLHADPAHAGAVFQVASQFNLLEMIDPNVSPEDGIARYAHDHTQGPASAISCGAGTIFRNYFVDTGVTDAGHARSGVGQNSWYQLDMLADLGAALGNYSEALWEMRNGYALPHRGALHTINQTIDGEDRDRLMGYLRIGLQSDTAVTLPDATHTVTQAYCSALPVAYSALPVADFEPFARLILDAAYEATLYAALRDAPDRPVFLTLLGGGAFGNPEAWIIDAIARAISIFKNSGLDVQIVSFGRTNPRLAPLFHEPAT